MIISDGSEIPALDTCPVNDRHVSVESVSPDGLLNNTHHITSETVDPDTSPKDVKYEVGLHAVSDNLTGEAMTDVKAHGYVSAAHLQAEEIINHDCVQSEEIDSESINGCGSQRKHSGYCAQDEVNLETTEADKSDMRVAEAINLHGLVHPGDSQSVQIASGSCEDITDVINERNEAAITADGNSEVSDKPGINWSSEPLEPDLQVNQTGQGDAPTLCGSGMAFHCASGGGTSCGNTEVIVLSNEAS